MKNLDRHLTEVGQRIMDSDGCMLMLDFDGTLSPISEIPGKAILSKATKGLLEACSARLPVAIISGRSLNDLKAKVRLNGLIYAGCHGMEWQVDGEFGQFKVPDDILKSIHSIPSRLKKLLPQFPGALFEDKKFSLVIHYRLVSPDQVALFKYKIMESLRPILDNGLEVIEGKKVFELRPKIDWNKGHFAEFAISHSEHKLKKRLLPIYVGDDTTDEDVFARFQNAVTIRVEKKAESAAKYYLENQGKVDGFLEWILEKA